MLATNNSLLTGFAHHRRSRGNGRKAARQAREENGRQGIEAKVPQRRTYDSTLDVTRRPATEQDAEALELFEQMKKREF